MATRCDVEADIALDGESLSKVASLLAERTLPSEWPEELRAILFLALSDIGNAAEVRKSAILRRHLFRGMAIPDALHVTGEIDPTWARRSERVRSDLVGLTKYGCGTFMLSTAESR